LSRLEREVSETLTRLVPVTAPTAPATAGYLRRKDLCAIARPGESIPDQARDRYRYKDIVVEWNAAGNAPELRVMDGDAATPLVWWQDLCLAGPGIRSRVGAVTTEGKAGSKTGVSHLGDWALLLDLLSNSGQLSAEGQLVARLGGFNSGIWEQNPYVLGTERLVFAYLHLAADFDFFARFAPKLLRQQAPIVKATATELYIETVREITSEAEEARYLSSRAQFRLFQHMRELERAPKRDQGHKDNSTAWHRTSSRMETYVDLGLLDKGKGGEDERYKYVYYPTETLGRLVDSLNATSSSQEWLEELLTGALFGRSDSQAAPSLDEVRRILPQVVAATGRPRSLLPISAVAMGIAWLKLDEGSAASLGACRRALESFARMYPGEARLSRGSYGERAEFISIDIGRDRSGR